MVFILLCLLLVLAVLLWYVVQGLLGYIYMPCCATRRTVHDKGALLITGCDSGFGKATAVALARTEPRLRVYACCYTKEGADAIAQHDVGRRVGASSRDSFGGLVAVRLDVCSQESVDAMVLAVSEDLAASGGSLQAVVNNAGVQLGGLIDWTPNDVTQQVMSVNFMGTVRVARALLPLLKRCAKGRSLSPPRIVNVISVNGLVTLPGIAAYAASKHATEAFTRSLRWEMIPFGVKVVSVNPGTFKTEMAAGAATRLQQTWDLAGAEVHAEYGQSYGPWVVEKVRSFTGAAADPDAVVQTLIEASLSAQPRRRYIVGWDACFLWIPLWLLPESVVDTAISFCIWLALPRPAGLQ